MGIKWGLLSHTRDIWVRDYMPLQLSENDFLLYQYQPDYLAQENYREYISNPKQICDELDITYSETSLIIDGGNISACGEFLVIPIRFSRKMERKSMIRISSAYYRKSLITKSSLSRGTKYLKKNLSDTRMDLFIGVMATKS